MEKCENLSPETASFNYQLFYKVRERSLGRVLSKLKKFLSRDIEERLLASGFTDFKVSYIVFLGNLEENGITNNELAKRAGVTKQAMSKIVKLLEDGGYIYTVKDPKDSRSSQIFMNERGKQLMKTVFNCMQKIREKYDAIAGHEQVEQMADTMLLLVRELEKEENT
ncbi:MarR family winged helix-turn-helix transcriptional regulator [Tellurirhabdus bombi]|uniref:MarR family winged helix-turn-helix transcriptional regulator n=1 Tax=Tellurirhabdus bombi TaxID=2907205 RepID=UPI001F398222|nr:MarR family transcriptional regulator [Tellurirhabdus bombi]